MDGKGKAVGKSKAPKRAVPVITDDVRRKEADALNRLMLQSAGNIAERIGSEAVFVYADACHSPTSLEKLFAKTHVVLITKDEETLSEEIKAFAKDVVKIPNINLTRMGYIKVAALMAINMDLLEQGDKAIFVMGIPELQTLDSIVVLDIGREIEMLSSANVRGLAENIKPAIFEAVLNLAIELAHQGREGKSVGTTFVIGDTETVMNRSRQLTINPFRGYSEEERNVLDQEVRETLKEFSSIDGAFVINEDGVVITAGRHLNAAYDKDGLPQGLGSRHASAAGITSVSNATAIVVSESTGDVRIFREGKIFLTIEKSSR